MCYLLVLEIKKGFGRFLDYFDAITIPCLTIPQRRSFHFAQHESAPIGARQNTREVKNERFLTWTRQSNVQIFGIICCL